MDEDEDPYTFHNLIIGKNEEGYWKRPYLLTYVMGEEFRPKYDATGSTEGFTGRLLKRYINPSTSDSRRGVVNNYEDPYTSNDPCDRETEVISAGSGGGDDPYTEFEAPTPSMGNTFCYTYWYYFETSTICGNDGYFTDCEMGVRRPFLVTECIEYGGSMAGSDPCDQDMEEVAVIEPENCWSIALDVNTTLNTCNEGFKDHLSGWLVENAKLGLDDDSALNPCEIALAIQFPVEAYTMYKNKKIAESITVSIFGINGLNDCSDAFRHAFFNAINTRDTNSSVALMFSSAHECDTPEHLIREKEMDLFNNKAGIDIGKNNANYNNAEMANAVLLKLLGGNLRRLSNLSNSSRPTESTELISTENCN